MFVRSLPDVVSELKSETFSSLQWVGMEGIAVPITAELQEDKLQRISARANVFVNIEKPEAKGIHMSRLHQIVNRLESQVCSRPHIEQCLTEMIQSQQGISTAARLELAFDTVLERKALLSEEHGYQAYPVVIKAEKTAQRSVFELEFTLPFSSTCPCSASLARQLYADALREKFSAATTIDKGELLEWVQHQAGSVATPHSQRSYARIRPALAGEWWPNLSALIAQYERVIGTPVQTVVKRVDEQAFAKLNAENLMFCEDVARRLKLALESEIHVENYWFKVEHHESLHAHNAVVVDQKYTDQ